MKNGGEKQGRCFTTSMVGKIDPKIYAPLKKNQCEHFPEFQKIQTDDDSDSDWVERNHIYLYKKET